MIVDLSQIHYAYQAYREGAIQAYPGGEVPAEVRDEARRLKNIWLTHTHFNDGNYGGDIGEMSSDQDPPESVVVRREDLLLAGARICMGNVATEPHIQPGDALHEFVASEIVAYEALIRQIEAAKLVNT